MRNYVTDEEINRAKEVDLLSYLQIAAPAQNPLSSQRIRRRRKPPFVKAGPLAGQANSFCARSVKKLASIEFCRQTATNDGIMPSLPPLSSKFAC